MHHNFYTVEPRMVILVSIPRFACDNINMIRGGAQLSFHQFHSMLNNFWSDGFFMEKWQEGFNVFFLVVQQYLIEQHGRKTTSLECFFFCITIHI